MFKIKLFFKSLFNALSGFITVWRQEQNFRFQASFGLLILILTFALPTSVVEKLVLVGLIFMVLSAEMINTSFEMMADVVKPREHPDIAKIKDVMAAVVVLAVILAIVFGVFILLPHVLEIFSF